MPRHNNPEITSRLRRFVAARGPAVIDTVAPEIVPIVIAADLTHHGDQGGQDLWAFATLRRTASVGNYSHVVLFNPAGSGVDLFVDRVWAAPNSNVNIRHLLTNTVSGYSQTTTQKIVSDIPGKDDFKIGISTPRAQLWTVAQAAEEPSARIFAQFYCPTQVCELDGMHLRIPPSFGLLTTSDTVNVAVTVNWQWFERPRFVS